MAQMVKNPPTMQDTWVQSLDLEDPLRRAWQSIPVFLPGESHGQLSLAGYSPWGPTESDTTERLSTHRSNNTKKNHFLNFMTIQPSSGGGLVAKSCLTLATPWTVACQAPLSVGFSRQEYWSGLPFPSPGDLSHPRIEHRSPTLQAGSLPTDLRGKSNLAIICYYFKYPPICE